MKASLTIIVSILLTLCLVEGFAWLLLEESQRQPFLIHMPEPGSPVNEGVSIIFDQIDPLLGWAMSHDKLRSTALEIDRGFVILRSCPKCEGDALHILITGGSTSDLSVFDHNWPMSLVSMLDERGLKTIVYVGAVGGYNSGQELLRLIRDGLKMKPDLHNSYSGANEAEPFYCSIQEYQMFNALVAPRMPLLPNAQIFMRKTMNNGTLVALSPHEGVLSPYEDTDSTVASFWISNMQLMHAASVEHGYQFVGILQPVLGSGAYDQELTVDYGWLNIERYKAYYPLLRETVAQNPEYLVDLTALFDGVDGDVFSDDCHLNAPYQPIVANAIFNVLIERELILRKVEKHPLDVY